MHLKKHEPSKAAECPWRSLASTWAVPLPLSAASWHPPDQLCHPCRRERGRGSEGERKREREIEMERERQRERERERERERKRHTNRETERESYHTTACVTPSRHESSTAPRLIGIWPSLQQATHQTHSQFMQLQADKQQTKLTDKSWLFMTL